MAGMKLSAIEKPRAVEADFGDGAVLNLTYDQSLLTPRVESELAGARDSAQMAKLLALLVTEWDLTEEDGTVVALEEDRLLDVPLVVLATVIKVVASDIADDVRAEGKA